MRSGRFSKKTPSLEQLKIEAEILYPKFQSLVTSYRDQHPALLVSEYIYLIWHYRHEHKMIGAKNIFFQPCKKLQDDQPLLFRWLNFWGSHILRSIPQKINFVMIWWLLDLIKLNLLDRIPSAYEILTWQSQGVRCVTLLQDQKSWENLILHERDMISFLIHDLLHAYEFNYSFLQFEQQKKFYQNLLLNYDQYQSYLISPEFAKRFEYIMSDMNGHEAHLTASLQSLLHDFSPTKN